MIDSHCHLDHEPLFSDLKNVIQRSKKIGVKKLLTISTSIESFSRVKEIVNKDEITKIRIKNLDKIEIVHFIGGG